MRVVDGFVCTAHSIDEQSWFLFGKNNGEGDELYAALETNGITLFSTQEEALAAVRQIVETRAGLFGMRVKQLSMRIAESKEDLQQIKSKGTFVVIQHMDKGGIAFLGKVSPPGASTAYPLPGAFLWQNGLRPLEHWENAEHMAREVMRQARCKASIATFWLR